MSVRLETLPSPPLTHMAADGDKSGDVSFTTGSGYTAGGSFTVNTGRATSGTAGAITMAVGISD